MLVTGHAQVEFQGVGSQSEGCLKALKGIFACLLRSTPMSNNQEITPWWLLSPWEPGLSTCQDHRGAESDSDAHA
jgi:hypothetical protein